MLAARVRALRRLHGDRHAAVEQARAEGQALLAGPAAVPALAALRLQQACGVECLAAVQRLADSLDGRPAARERFLAHWAPSDLQR
jgi:hypothetical protein